MNTQIALNHLTKLNILENNLDKQNQTQLSVFRVPEHENTRGIPVSLNKNAT